MPPNARVLFQPFWESNPYHVRLRDYLRNEGFDVLPLKGLPTFDSTPANTILHVHGLSRLVSSPDPEERTRCLEAVTEQIRTLPGDLPVAWTVHDVDYGPDSREMLGSLARRTDALIVHSQSALDTIRTTYELKSPEPIFEIIPHPNYIGAFRPGPGRLPAR